MKDSAQRYGGISRLFHWLMAAIVLFQFLKFFDRIDDGEHAVGLFIKPLHGSIGAVFLVLVALRLLWVAAQSQRPAYQGALAGMAKLGHRLLYLFMVLLPVTGLSRGLGRGNGIKVFGQQIVQGSGERTEWLVTLGSLHSTVAWTLAVLVAGHIAMALYHHFIVKDDTLRRMAG